MRADEKPSVWWAVAAYALAGWIGWTTIRAASAETYDGGGFPQVVVISIFIAIFACLYAAQRVHEARHEWKLRRLTEKYNARGKKTGSAVIVAVLAASMAPCMALAADRVVDGDTLVVGGQRVRLYGYNAPEMSQPGGPEAKARLDALIAGRPVVCEKPRARDRYGRIIARSSVDGLDLSTAMRH